MEFYRRDSTFRSSFRVIRKIARAVEEWDRPRKRARNFDWLVAVRSEIQREHGIPQPPRSPSPSNLPHLFIQISRFINRVNTGSSARFSITESFSRKRARKNRAQTITRRPNAIARLLFPLHVPVSLRLRYAISIRYADISWKKELAYSRAGYRLPVGLPRAAAYPVSLPVFRLTIHFPARLSCETADY